MAFEISKATIQDKTIEAFKNGRLLAQNMETHCPTGEYFYQKPGSDVGCAIGVALPSDIALSLTQSQKIKNAGSQVSAGDWSVELQHLHDRWADAEFDLMSYVESDKDNLWNKYDCINHASAMKAKFVKHLFLGKEDQINAA